MDWNWLIGTTIGMFVVCIVAFVLNAIASKLDARDLKQDEPPWDTMNYKPFDNVNRPPSYPRPAAPPTPPRKEKPFTGYTGE